MASRVLAWALCFYGSLSAQVKAKDYKNLRDTQDFQLYLKGVGSGLDWANAELMGRHQVPLYCLPPSFVLTTENLLQTIDVLLPTVTHLNLSIELVLLKGLINTFPCRK